MANNTNLHLSLIRRYFEMTDSGFKPEDYRSVNEYWCNRFILVHGEVKSKEWWMYNINVGDDFFEWLIDNFKIGNFTFKTFTQNIMTLGYPKRDDESRIIRFKHAGIEIRTGNPEWGAEPGKLYFVIKHGNRIL